MICLGDSQFRLTLRGGDRAKAVKADGIGRAVGVRATYEVLVRELLCHFTKVVMPEKRVFRCFHSRQGQELFKFFNVHARECSTR